MPGEAVMVDPPDAAPTPFFQVFLGGPRPRPIVGYNPGLVDVFSVMLYPDALQALTGIEMAHCVDRFQPLPAVLPPDWVALADSVRARRTMRPGWRWWKPF